VWTPITASWRIKQYYRKELLWKLTDNVCVRPNLLIEIFFSLFLKRFVCNCSLVLHRRIRQPKKRQPKFSSTSHRQFTNRFSISQKCHYDGPDLLQRSDDQYNIACGEDWRCGSPNVAIYDACRMPELCKERGSLVAVVWTLFWIPTKPPDILSYRAEARRWLLPFSKFVVADFMVHKSLFTWSFRSSPAAIFERWRVSRSETQSVR